MRFIRTIPSGKDKDIPVFEFLFGLEELRLLISICKPARRNMPDMFEYHSMKGRLNNIIKEFEKTLKGYKEKSVDKSKG